MKEKLSKITAVGTIELYLKWRYHRINLAMMSLAISISASSLEG